MNARIRPGPRPAEELLAKLKEQRFDVQVEQYQHDTWVEEDAVVLNEERVLESIRKLTGCDFVAVMVEGTYRPPGQYPLAQLTVVLNIEGVPVRAFFG